MAEKKAQQLPPLRTTLIDPDPHEPNAYVLELDELWSFVLKKVNQVWIWLAICRKTRQIVGYALGRRDEATCRKLWHSIPHKYRRGASYTDFWEVYQAVIPVTNIGPSGKRVDKRRISSASITHCASDWRAWSVKRFRSQNRR